MQILRDISSMKAWVKAQKATSRTIGFVPTMGALHEGHLHLLDTSRSKNDLTVCSIFVNPAQFNNAQDLAKYPRTFDKDAALLTQRGCDALFYPSTGEMYPEPSSVSIDFGELDKILEGKFRPGHFNGVALVVSKLLHIIAPDRAYFGQKDYQQFVIISTLVRNLQFDVQLICVPTIRESSGLALSSRNLRLSEEERTQATVLYQALKRVRQELLSGAMLQNILPEVETMFAAAGAQLEYLALADRKNLAILDRVTVPEECMLLVAAYIGEVRLIDNMFLTQGD